MVNQWTGTDIPDMTGKIAIITGANSGLGYESTLALAKKNATIIMACRSIDKAQSALDAIKQQVSGADAHIMTLDLGDLSSVRDFASTFKAQYERLDILLNNAGLMATPFRETPDGFETQFGVNHLGHFALTGLLLDRLLNTPASRVVNVSSGLHRNGTMNFDDLHMKSSYSGWNAYYQSKLANILFTRALDKRLQGQDTIAVAAHPGYASTNLQTKTGNAIQTFIMEKVMNPLMAQSAAKGALPQLYAATAADVSGGNFFGPHFMRLRGYPVLEVPSDAAQNDDDAERLWQMSVEMTQVDYAMLKAAPTQS